MKFKVEQKIKVIIISDGTGETASAMARACMVQFPNMDVYFTRYKNVRTKEQIEAIFTEAAIHHDLILYTIISSSLREFTAEVSRKKHVRSVDLLGPLLTSLSNFFDVEPDSRPGLLHEVNQQYFDRVAAMEFTLNHDDGRNLESLHLADIILVGISRTSKTPLSMYLSLNGHKVVNIPIVNGVDLPEGLKEVDQRKIFGLTIDSSYLEEIRKNRLSRLGSKMTGEYAQRNKIVNEVEWANEIFKRNKRWPIIDVTNKALEETASEIIRLFNMRKNNVFKQSKRFES